MGGEFPIYGARRVRGLWFASLSAHGRRSGAHIATQTGEGLLRADALVRQMAGVLPENMIVTRAEGRPARIALSVCHTMRFSMVFGLVWYAGIGGVVSGH